MFAPPPSMKAIVIQEDRTAGYLDKLIPIIDDGEVLVKTYAVALNNSDWKGTLGKVDGIVGWDVSGEIVQVGKNVTTCKVGQRVAAVVHGGYWRDRGAFSEYVKVEGELLWVLPEKTSFEEAATLSCGTWTVVQSLFSPTRLGLVEPDAEGDPILRDEWVFVYGGSTSCGMYAIQLLHAGGYKVVTTASPCNFRLLKSLGATAVFDYRDPEAVMEVKAVTGDSITKVLDCISTTESRQFWQGAVSLEGGKVIVLLPLEDIDIDIETPPKDIVHQFTFIGTALGKEVTTIGQSFPVSPEDQAQIASFVKKMPILIEQGKLVPNPIKLWPGGLAAIPEGVQYIQEGKQSAEKIVFSL
ncbi:hypothetical protein V8D89_009246 [Ganoderma adspersum]